MSQDKTISRFLESIKKTLIKYNMVEAGELVIVATSGGLDSMALLDCLYMLHKDLKVSLMVAHLDHGLRGEESRRESLFVRQQAQQYGLPFETGHLCYQDYPKSSSVQNQARLLRYQFFEEVKCKWHAHKVALAHHRDDNVETILMRILRCTGSQGLRGISPVRTGGYIRPFIETSRKEIEEFYRKRNIHHVEDSSNRNSIYFRNRVRQELIPLLQERFNFSFTSDTLIHMATILEKEDEYLEEVTKRHFQAMVEHVVEGAEIVVRKHMLLPLHPAVQKRVLRMAYGRLQGTRYGIYYAHIEGVCNGLRRNRPHQHYYLPGGVHVYFEYDRMRFTRELLWEGISFDIPHCIGDRTFIPEIGIWIYSNVLPNDVRPCWRQLDSKEAVLSLPTPVEEIRIRNFRQGDRFYPLGLHNAKKLKDFYIDEKIPRSMRHRIPLVEIGGKIAWIVGYRIDERFKVNSENSPCIQFTAY